MHSFDNSQSTSRKKNNWQLLGLFFKKELPEIDENDYLNIQNSNFQGLSNFMKKIYQILTKRK